jgi:putative ABC transport system permease protein
MNGWVQDFRLATRQLRRQFSFGCFAILILAIGIGTNSAMFSVIRTVLFQPLPYWQSGRIVEITGGATPIRFEELKAGARSYSDVAAYSDMQEELALSGSSEPEMLRGARVSANFLSVLGVTPLLGRSFVQEEDKPGAPAVALISADLWHRQFHGDPRVIGETVTLEGSPHTIVGVLPPGFQFPSSGLEVWVTKPSESARITGASRSLSPVLHLVGRLNPGLNLQQADSELAVLDHQYSGAHPEMLDSKPQSTEHVTPLLDTIVFDVRPKLWLLFGAVGFILLIACANIGALQIVRAGLREQEFGIRLAIGAGKVRIIRQLLAENILLAILGGALGVILAAATLTGIRSTTFVDLPRANEIRMNGEVVAFALILSLGTGIICGLSPAIKFARLDLTCVLRGAHKTRESISSRIAQFLGPRSILVMGQVALCTVLLIGSTLLLQSLTRLYQVAGTFQPATLLTMHLTLASSLYNSDLKQATFYEKLTEQVKTLPGVRNAAVTLTLPMTGWAGSPVQLSDAPRLKLNERPISIVQLVSPDYFNTLRIPVKRGRQFTAHDNLSSAPVVIISETLARHFWPQYPAGPDPIGQQILIGANPQPKEIVGIVADVGQDPLYNVRMELYQPCFQSPNLSTTLAVRADGDPLLLANEVRKQILAIGPAQPVSDVMTMNDVVETSQGQLRLMTRLLTAFAVLATMLAILGLYGVISYSVARRTKELGIRCALGASRANILSLVISQGFGLALSGVAIGVCGAFGLGGVLGDLLFGVGATNPMAYVVVPALFILVALLASYVPARRAAQVDPMVALRYE